MRNFDYLQELGLSELHRFCAAAEELQASQPDNSATNSRRALEYLVRAIYIAKQVKIGERASLFELVSGEPFATFVDNDRLMMGVHYIRKVGNNGAHGLAVKRSESFFCLLNLYNLVAATLIKLRIMKSVAPFDKTLVPPQPKQPTLVPTNIDTKELSAQILPEAVATPTETVLLPTDLTEADTRLLYIDLMLREAGWDIAENEGQIVAGKACIEIEVQGMPNNQGVGYADYVLFGTSGQPLAVVEAKRTSKSPEVGKHQAELYADCLEKRFGVRPVIYYTNGYKTKIIDGMGYPPRDLLSFHTLRELELIIQHRNRKEITDTKIKENIAGRHYQQTAVKRLCEHFNKKNRRGLLVMATGTGKTRVAISLVELLTRNGWVKNVLFLADRTSLVKQAHKNFVKLLPDFPTCILSDSTNENRDLNARLMFSTYQTMINTIDTDTKLFGIGRFDLIIIDEAHRSIFGKYGAIFNYFDCLLVGLTATPRDEVDRSTYQIFNLEQGVPNFAYELEEAVADGYLVNYTGFKRGTVILENGIKYDSLSEEEKKQLEPVWEYEAAQESVNIDCLDRPSQRDIKRNEIFSYIYNTDTIDKVLVDLMDNGLKIKGGDEIGKSIIFAANHKHAEMIVQRFNALYPHLGADYCVLIDNYVNYSQDLIEKFEVRNSQPQIAVSVDMLDTGIDVPDVLNLVFFKTVKSKIKFLQMIGRGTRLSTDIFGEGNHKELFYIFDWCANFDYFSRNTNGTEGTQSVSLTERLFGIRCEIVQHLQHQQYQEQEFTKTWHDDLKKELHAQVEQLNENHISVRAHWEVVCQFKSAESWQNLSEVDVVMLKSDIAPLLQKSGNDEMAKRFDIIMMTIELAQLDSTVKSKICIKKVTTISELLLKRANIPQIKNKIPTINEVINCDWKNISFPWLEKVRLDLRDLLQFLVGSSQTFVISVDDIFVDNGTAETVTPTVSYRKRIIDFLAQNRNLPVLQKIRNVESLTLNDIAQLENILWNELGNKDDYNQQIEQSSKFNFSTNVAIFIRSIIGIDYSQAMQKFGRFIALSELNSEQEEFLKQIISYVCENGDITKNTIVNNPKFEACNYLFGSNITPIAQFVTILHSAVTPQRELA